MSKKHGHRKKRRVKTRPACCPACHGPADATPGAHLRGFAALMNSAAGAGVRIHFLAARAAGSSEGMVLRLSGAWVVRTPSGEPFPDAPDYDEEGLDT